VGGSPATYTTISASAWLRRRSVLPCRGRQPPTTSAAGSRVVAYRAAVCAIGGDAPFYALCKLGNSQDIRGYAVGVYQDRRMIVGQVEYRRELPWRFGLAAFFGLGEVADSFGDFNGDDILPGGGIGVRFLLAEQNHINLRVDYAWGRDSSALYVGLLEAF